MLEKEEFIKQLRESTSYMDTHRAVQALKKDVQWTKEEMRELIYIAVECGQVYGTLNYQANSQVGDFYRKILRDYTKMVNKDVDIQDVNVQKLIKKVWIIPNEEIYEYMIEQKEVLMNSYRVNYRDKGWTDEEHGIKVTVCDGLYHANSVSTSISYIRNKILYSRQYGDDYFQHFQTVQASDDSDKKDGVYNDLFFDNCDIRSISKNHSPYGPISFVVDEKVLRDPFSTIRITKVNPWHTRSGKPFREMAYEERYYTSIRALREGEGEFPFRSRTDHHTTFWNKSKLDLTQDVLKYILLDRNKDMDRTLRVKERLEEELAQAGLTKVPVILRQSDPWMDVTPAAPFEVLWKLPEE